MKLTEDNIQVEEGFIVIPNNLVFEEAKKIKQQILSDNKLRELIEKRIEEFEKEEENLAQNQFGSGYHSICGQFLAELQQLLEDSKTSKNFREIKILEDDE